MLRFKPDGVLEGLLRPFIMVDPVAGVYFETMAPDLRFAALLLLLAAAGAGVAWRLRPGGSPGQAAANGRRSVVHAGQWRGLIGLAVMFFAWTFAIGNGRYFISGLLLVGPLLALACSLIPGTRALRATVLALILGLQCFAVALAYAPNTWGMARWSAGVGLGIQDSPLREQPAVFLTVSTISYSIIVPQFHPQSRWANVAGQRDILPGSPEYPKLKQLLDSPMPKYAVMAINHEQSVSTGQPNASVRHMLNVSLAPLSLRLTEGGCQVLRSSLATTMRDVQGHDNSRLGFWFCAVAAGPDASLDRPASMPAWEAVFAKLEERCPRFFPPGDSKLRQFNGVSTRYYTGSDTRVYVDAQGEVLFHYFRAMNPTYVGNAEKVLRGEFELACDKLPGRYLPPWQRH